jgi:capsular polysaccharide transport system permease protein
VIPPTAKPQDGTPDDASTTPEPQIGDSEAKLADVEIEGVTRLRPGGMRRPGGPGGAGLGPRAAARRAAAQAEEAEVADAGPGRPSLPRRPQGQGPANRLGAGPRVRRDQDDDKVKHLARSGAPLVREDDGESDDGFDAVDVTPALPRSAAFDLATADAMVIAERRQPDGDAPARPAKPGRKSKPESEESAGYIPAPTVQPARMRQRHWGLVALFMLMVVLPAVGYSGYLYTVAADQYESDVGFGSRTEDTPSSFSFLGLLGGSGASSASDMDVVNQFISSQELVVRIDKQLNLRKIYSRPARDWLAAFPVDGSLEDLVDYWQKMVVVNFDRSTGLMTLKIFAFDPKDAQDIAKAVLAESTSIINELSKTAQDDSTRYSREALAKAESRMTETQNALTAFQLKHHIVDPSVQVGGTAQVVGSLIGQLASAEIDLDMLTGTVPDNDPRIGQLKRRIDVIQKRMDAEQAKVGGLSDTESAGFAKLTIDYQNLQMAQDFAQKAYLTSLGAYDQAVNNAEHKTRYLATYLQPTVAETSTAPNRPLRIFLLVLAGLFSWSALAMIYYALRDRR